MQLREHLTNENFRGLFKSNFELANASIRLARYYIKSGEEVDMDDLLEELRKNPNLYEQEVLAAKQEKEEQEAGN